jgi:hypothetical protein
MMRELCKDLLITSFFLISLWGFVSGDFIISSLSFTTTAALSGAFISEQRGGSTKANKIES